MKKITKIVSFCAAVTMAATAVPASSLLMAKAADVPKITIGSGSKDDPIAVKPGQANVKIPLYMHATGDTEGISFGFIATGEGKATKALLTASTYVGAFPSESFTNLGAWEENPNGLSWGVAKAPSSDAVKVSDILDDDPFISLFYTMPDEKTVEDCAEAGGLKKVNKGDQAYYDFPLEIDTKSVNNKGGKLFTWAGTNGTRYEAAADVTGTTVIRVYVTPDDSDVTTTTATTTTTAQTTTTTIAQTTTTTIAQTTTTVTTTTNAPESDLPELNVNNQEKIFVEPTENVTIPLYMKNAVDTVGLSFGFKLDGEAAATKALLNATDDTYQSYYAINGFLDLGAWEENPKGLSWAVPASGNNVLKGSDISPDEPAISLYYKIPDEATVQDIAQKNGLIPKHGENDKGETVSYYEFPLEFDRDRLNSKLGHIVEWAGADNTRVNASYKGSSICVVVNTPTIKVNESEIVEVDAGDQYAKIPLNMYNAEDTVGITIAFKTDGEGAATRALLDANEDTYQSYYATDEFLNLGSWEENPKGLSWGVPSNGTSVAKASNITDGEAFFTLYYNIPNKEKVEEIAKANGLKPQKDADESTYYDFPLTFETEKKNDKGGRLLDWVGPNDVSIRARASYEDNILRVYTNRKSITKVDTRVEVSGEEVTDASGNTVDSHKIFVEPGQEYVKIPLKVYDAVDATAVSFAFQTDGEGAATQRLLNSQGAYTEFYEFASVLNDLGTSLDNNNELVWGVSSTDQIAKGTDMADGSTIFAVYYNIPNVTASDLAEMGGKLVAADDPANMKGKAYYEFQLISD